MIEWISIADETFVNIATGVRVSFGEGEIRIALLRRGDNPAGMHEMWAPSLSRKIARGDQDRLIAQLRERSISTF